MDVNGGTNILYKILKREIYIHELSFIYFSNDFESKDQCFQDTLFCGIVYPHIKYAITSSNTKAIASEKKCLTEALPA